MKTTLLLGVHSHQPIDNFDHVVLDAIKSSYRPFFETVAKTPSFKCSAHYSGWLLEFISTHDTELFDLMKKLTKAGQIEWLTGGYYEPILASIPSYYRRKQIEKLSNFIEKNFGVRPTGLWLTERVWDASIVADLASVGVEYAVVDDYHLLCTGLKRENLNGYYMTENGGNKLALFPISKALRYQVPFWEKDTVIENIGKFDGAAIIFDDGEKFGLWPGTHEWVYTKGWLDGFAKSVASSETISAQTYGEFFRSHAPLGLVYPPEVSYFEMGEWSLNPKDSIRLENLKNELENGGKADEAEHFLRGATWKNFLVKYSESNKIHKRMLELSQKSVGNSDAELAIMKAQCNDVLWHGIFGGLYLPNLRDNAWRYLIECENSLNPKNGLDLIGIYMNGSYEARFTTDLMIAGFESTGALLSELNLRNEKFNLLNTLKRRIEAYHHKIEAKNSTDQNADGAKTIHDFKLYADSSDLKHIVEDKNARGGFIDHLVVGEFNLDRFFAQDFKTSSDLANSIYKMTQDGDNIIYSSDLITKTFSVKNNQISSDLMIKSTDARYVQEHNFHFAEVDRVLINGRSIKEDLVFEPETSLTIEDPYLLKTIVLEANCPFVTYSHMLLSVSQSESGVDLTAQGVAIALDFGTVNSDKKIAITLTIKERL